MAITGADRGTGTDQTGATSVAIIPASNFTAGATAILVLAYDNEGGIDNYSSISDSIGNTWASVLNGMDSPGGADQDGVCLRVFICHQNIGNITTGTTITVNFGAASVVDKAWTLSEGYSDTGRGLTFAYLSGISTSGTTTATTSTSEAIAAETMIVGCFAVEGGGAAAITADSDTTNGSWSSAQYADGGSGTGNISAFSQYKIVTASGSQTYNVGTPNSDRVIGHIVLMENGTLVGTNLGSGSGNVSATSFAVTAPNCTAGAMVLYAICYENSGTNGADPFNTISDSLGNTWESLHNALVDPGAANAGVATRLFMTYQNAGTLTTSSTITIDFGAFNVQYKAYTFTEFRTLLPGYIIKYVQGGTDTATATTANTITSPAIPAGHCVFVASGSEDISGSQAGDADTTRGEWSTFQGNASLIEATILTQFKIILNGSAAQNHAYSANGMVTDFAGVWIEIYESELYDLIATDRGAGANTTPATTYQFSPSSNFATGSTAILIIGYDYTGGADPFNTITDSKGNSWNLKLNDIDTSDICYRYYTSDQANGALQTSDTVTIDFGVNSVDDKAYSFIELKNTYGGPITYLSGATAYAVSNSASVTSATAHIGEYAVGGITIANSGTTITPDSELSTEQTANASGGAIKISSQHKKIINDGALTYNVGLSSAPNGVIGIGIFKGEPLPSFVDPFGQFGIFGI